MECGLVFGCGMVYCAFLCPDFQDAARSNSLTFDSIDFGCLFGVLFLCFAEK